MSLVNPFCWCIGTLKDPSSRNFQTPLGRSYSHGLLHMWLLALGFGTDGQTCGIAADESPNNMPSCLVRCNITWIYLSVTNSIRYYLGPFIHSEWLIKVEYGGISETKGQLSSPTHQLVYDSFEKERTEYHLIIMCETSFTN